MPGREKKTRIVKKLKHTEARYRELFDNIYICVVVYKVRGDGEDFVIKDFNSAAEKVEKVSRRDVIGKGILEVFPGMQDFGLCEVMRKVWQTGIPGRLPSKFYQDSFRSGWRDSYIYKLPSGDIVVVYEDTTESKKAEDALKAAELRYRTVADFTYDWEFWLTPEGRPVYVSPSCERITGYTAAQFIKNWRLMERILLPEEMERWAEHVRKINLGLTVINTFRIKRKDGEVRWIEHVCRPIIDENGRHLGTRGSNRDVTERILAEEALRQSEEQLHSLFFNMQEGVAMHELVFDEGGRPVDYRVVNVNPQFEKIFNVKAEDVRGKLAGEVYATSDECFLPEINTVALTGKPLRFQTYFGRRDRYFDISIVPWGQRGSAAIFTDITVFRKLEEENRNALEQYRLLADNAEDVIWKIDADLNFTYISPSIHRLLGFEPEEALRRSLEESMTPQSLNAVFNAIQANQDVIAGGPGKHVSVEVEMYRQDGTTVWLEAVGRALYDAAGKHAGFVGVSRDITERRQLETELRNRESMFRVVFENYYQYIGLFDPEGHLLAANNFALGVAGATEDEIKGKYFWDTPWWRHSKEVQQQLQASMGEVAAQGKLINFNTTLIDFHGKIRTIDFMLNPIHDDNGRTIYIVASALDIAE